MSVEKFFLSKKEVSHVVGFSLAHIDRMEYDEDYQHFGFPKRRQIGFRVFWVRTEVLAWCQDRAELSDAPT